MPKSEVQPLPESRHGRKMDHTQHSSSPIYHIYRDRELGTESVMLEFLSFFHPYSASLLLTQRKPFSIASRFCRVELNQPEVLS
jgi:hypothetical protein